MMMPNDELLKKIVGNPLDEAPEAAYRLAASLLVKGVQRRAIDKFVIDDEFMVMINKYPRIVEVVLGFMLSAALELLPTPILGNKRRRLAYNLRVQSYQDVGHFLISLTPLLQLVEEEAERALQLANEILPEAGHPPMGSAENVQQSDINSGADGGKAKEAGEGQGGPAAVPTEAKDKSSESHQTRSRRREARGQVSAQESEEAVTAESTGQAS